MTLASEIIVPGDKSITHRALMLAAVAPGESVLRGALSSLDTRSTARMLRGLGVDIGTLTLSRPVTIGGRRQLRAPGSPLNCGNSGTTARLGMGLLAASPFSAEFLGDASLRKRPMRRVTEPLTAMGVTFEPALAEQLPLSMLGGRLSPIRQRLPVSSAQLKSALLLAGLVGEVAVAVQEPDGLSRDHTERMLRALGVAVVDQDGWIELTPGRPIERFEMTIPADPSSAAFLLGAAVIAGRPLSLDRISHNPTRLGFLAVLTRMGAQVQTGFQGESLGEPFGSIAVGSGKLVAARVDATEIPGLIDEIPMLAVVAARAEGTTTFEQVGELRVKESDRLKLIADNLTRLGYRASGEANILRVTGSDHPPVGRVVTSGDHRIAMAFASLGLVKRSRISIEDRACVGVSFPGFYEALRVVKEGR